MFSNYDQEKESLIPSRNVSRKHYGEKKSEENHETNRDSSYSAVGVLAAAFFIVAVKDGTIHASKVFVDILANETHASRDTITAIGTTELFISGAGAPLASSLINLHGPKVVCVTGAIVSALGMLVVTLVPTGVYGFFIAQSLVSGLGLSCTWVAALVGLKEHFTEKRFLALAFALCGGVFGRPVVEMVTGWLLSMFGWQLAMYALSGLCLACALVGQVFTKYYNTREKGENRVLVLLEKKALTARSLIQFLLVIVADALVVTGLHIFTCYLQPVVLALGVQEDSADLLLYIGGVGCVGGLLVSGLLSDKGWYHPVEIAALVILSSSTLPALITIQTQYSMFALYSSFLGFLTGYWLAATNHILVSVIGLNQFASTLGLLLGARSLAMLSAPLTVNFLMSVAGEDPSNVLYMSSAILGVACCLYSAAGFFIRRHSDIVRGEEGCLEWDSVGEEWDQDECQWEYEQCEPCDSPCPEETGRRVGRSEGEDGCLLSCDNDAGDEESCQPCDEEESRVGVKTDSVPCEQNYEDQ